MAPPIGVAGGAAQLRVLRRIGIPPSRGSLHPCWVGGLLRLGSVAGPAHPSLYRNLPAKSNRLESQDAGVIGSQCFPVFAMLLSMISNFRIQAVRASFLGFPAARSRW